MSKNDHIDNQPSPNKPDGPHQPLEADSFYKMLGHLLAQRWKREWEQTETPKTS